MSTEVEFLRDQVQRLNSALSHYQDRHRSEATSAPQGEEERHTETPAPWLSDQSIMAPLLSEYDRHMDDMTEQLQSYQMQMTAIRLKLDTVVKENERLHAELRESVERQLQTLPVSTGPGVEGDTLGDEGLISNLHQQIQLSVQERDQAMELWRASAQELDRLQQLYQITTSDGQLHVAEQQRLKDQLIQFQQHIQKLQVTNQKLESTNQQFLKTLTEQSTEMEELRNQLRSAKADLRMATAKVEEMTKLMQNVQDQIQRREDDAAEAHGREEASDRRLHHLQSALSQLEARLKAASQEAEGVRREQVVWERQVGELQVRCASLEEERYEAFSKVRDSIQLAEEASLQKDQALLREKQKSEELDRMNEAIRQLIQDAAIRTRKEVENVRKQCNSQIHRMAEELSALQLECADKESQMERSMREMRAVEEELEKVYKEGRGEPEYRKMEVLHQRSLNAERLKDDMNITLQSTHNKMKKLEMDYSEELSRCQEEVRRLQGSLSAAREDCSGVSEERLQLQQENMQLRREMEELRKASMMTQRRAKQQVSQMEQEYSLKEQGLEARVRELEENSRSSSADLTRLLSAQQKTSQRWKEEAKTLTLTFHTKLTSLKGELSRQKQRCQELEIQLVTDHETIVEYERQMAEYQEKNSRLQRRLTQAEQKATTASQQLSIMTSQRRKTSSMADLESL
ncbi:sodium channel and clathrin linker 1 isoform X2 [Oncorhynchus kisutch]|uniref:Sodium channel and clathrin linker 1 n=2 Tax=Oncorhynchus kisutch TaxID=8019 RepID=A0A8C7JXX7_ONCKI|nr:sodium channel and clathrin linker 1 isoform X2 [Oncorhynchus kisutch]XP_031670377.1 sodium channel and clathrin linker 1 isoform X2 [Oncorhynchus kisutch]XP_031670378.1 sodium channel and clathrin linker 1 isoform X2 [Oncorhynchus kisutch]